MIENAIKIWWAGVNSVDPQSLIQTMIKCTETSLQVNGNPIDLESIRKILVVGGGKAGATMALGLEQSLAPLAEHIQICGSVIVPVDQSQADGLRLIKLIPGRDKHENLPTLMGVTATRGILDDIARLKSSDLCIALISGGGSALLVAPKPPVTLDDKIATIKLLIDAGATIRQLNTIRAKLSLVKSGGLASHCQAKKLLSFILSDVIGDPLEFVASGPTIPHAVTSFREIQGILNDLKLDLEKLPTNVQYALMEGDASEPIVAEHSTTHAERVVNVLIGNNQTALDGASQFALEQGFQVSSKTLKPETLLDDLADAISENILSDLNSEAPTCCLIGGEPVLPLIHESQRGVGGRNQQLVLEVWRRLKDRCGETWSNDYQFSLLAAGTDGEDGPTNAAGGWVDSSTFSNVARDSLVAHCERNNAYPLLFEIGQLFQTGMTGTNVCDLMVLTRHRSRWQ